MLYYTIKADGKKAGRYENVVVGEEMGPFTYPVDDYSVKAYSFAVDDYSPWYYTDNNPFGKRIAHASFPCNDCLSIFLTVFEPSGVMGLHTEEEIWFHNPIFVGEDVTISAKIVDKFVKRGKGHWCFETKLVGEDGRPIIDTRSTEIMHFEASELTEEKKAKITGAVVTGEYDKTKAPVKKGTADVTPGTPLVSLTKIFHPEQAQIYSWVGQHFKNIHDNLAYAKEAGYDNLVVQGMQQLGCMCELLTDFYDANWFTSGHLKMKMIRTVLVGETITFHAVVKSVEKENDRNKVHLDVWTLNEKGQMTTIGWASAYVD